MCTCSFSLWLWGTIYSQGMVPFITDAFCLQLALRAFNNLEERFHHSFFLYLLTSATTFVTVENYVAPLAALILLLLLKVGVCMHVYVRCELNDFALCAHVLCLFRC